MFSLRKRQQKASDTQTPQLSSEQADQLLKNIIRDLELSNAPSSSKHRSCYYKLLRKYIFKNVSVLVMIFLVLFFVLPGTIVPASISHVEAAPISNRASARVEFRINSFIPVREINASLNEKPLDIREEGYQKYSIDIKENGYLLLEVYSVTGLHSSQSVKVDSIDDEAPHIMNHCLEDGNIKIFLSDKDGVGIDYGSIIAFIPEAGQYERPLRVDSGEGYAIFKYPQSRTYITVADKNGNEMTAVLSPPGDSS